MRKHYSNKSFFDGIWKQAAVFLALLAAVIFVSVSLAGKLIKGREVNDEISGLQSEVDDLNRRNNDLRQLIDYLDSDSFISEQARKNLNYKKEGEEVLVINDGGEAAEEYENHYKIAGDDVEPKAEGNPVRWFRYFFH